MWLQTFKEIFLCEIEKVSFTLSFLFSYKKNERSKYMQLNLVVQIAQKSLLLTPLKSQERQS